MRVRTEFSRWEIGDQPQPGKSLNAKFSRWEIGDQPQHRAIVVDQFGSLADGRSGTSRNTRGQYYQRASKFSRWEIGDQPQLIFLPVHKQHKFSRWEIGDQPQRGLFWAHPENQFSRWEIGDQPQRNRGMASAGMKEV